MKNLLLQRIKKSAYDMPPQTAYMAENPAQSQNGINVDFNNNTVTVDKGYNIPGAQKFVMTVSFYSETDVMSDKNALKACMAKILGGYPCSIDAIGEHQYRIEIPGKTTEQNKENIKAGLKQMLDNYPQYENVQVE